MPRHAALKAASREWVLSLIIMFSVVTTFTGVRVLSSLAFGGPGPKNAAETPKHNGGVP